VPQKTETIQCHQCKNNECLIRHPNGIPEYCQAQGYRELIEKNKQPYHDMDIKRIHLATARVINRGKDDWNRIKQCIEFARELGVTRVGLAVCVALLREGREFARFLGRAGFQVVSVACTIGGLNPQETGISDEWVSPRGISCNPIAQAEIMNEEKTELNFVYGLCVGHDTLFMMKSKAPVTYVAVKDTVTGNNPSAVLHSTFHRLKLMDDYKKK